MKMSIIRLLISLTLTIAMFGNTVVFAHETQQPNGITVLVDGNSVIFDQEPLLINGRVMVSVKAVGEMMGWEVRENGSTVIELAKAVKYTDGTRNYLFSVNTVAVNLERKVINRSIMVGVGRFFETDADKNIALTASPTVVNGMTLISVRDLAECLYAAVEWDGDNQTVIITSGTIPYYDGQGLENRDELFEGMRKYNKVSGVLTKVGDKSVQSAEKTTPKITSLFQPSGVMTKAPEIGSFPAKILLPGKTDVTKADSYYEPYKIDVGYGCNWYTTARFYETYGYQINVPYFGGKTYLDDIDKLDIASVGTERDLNKIISGCVAVYWRNGVGGHVVFVEYVERDADGNPVNIYYTECMNSSKEGTYRPATDGKVKKATFERFKKSNSGTKDLTGYVVPIQ